MILARTQAATPTPPSISKASCEPQAGTHVEVLPTCVGPAIIPDPDQLTVFTAQIYI